MRRMVYRVYLFMAAVSLAIMVALIVVPRYARNARYLEPQAALVQFMVQRWSTKSPAEFTEAFERLEPRLRGRFSVYSADGKLLHTSIEPRSRRRPAPRSPTSRMRSGRCRPGASSCAATTRR